MADFKFKFSLTDDSYDCIIEMAGYGISYWANYMESTDKGCHFTDGISGDKYFVTQKMVETAAADLYTAAPLNDYYMSAITALVVRGCPGDVGSDIADALIQQACFGEVKYG